MHPVASTLFEGLRFGAIASAFALGIRHGFDWDHIAAITDITGSQTEHRRSLTLATLYIAGHALVVTVLGVAAIVAGSTIPTWLDGVMGRIVGATLIGLGVYVLVSLVRHGREARLRSRWMLAAAGLRRLVRWFRTRRQSETVVVEHDHEHAPDPGHHAEADEPAVVAAGEAAPVAVAVAHRHAHHHVGSLPDDPFVDYGRGTSLLVGMLHGIGGETPTQMVLFASAAGAGTAWVGTTFLLAFVVGLVLANTLVALGARFGLLNAARNFVAYAAFTVVVGGLSLYLGTAFLLGTGGGLPALFS